MLKILFSAFTWPEYGALNPPAKEWPFTESAGNLREELEEQFLRKREIKQGGV